MRSAVVNTFPQKNNLRTTVSVYVPLSVAVEHPVEQPVAIDHPVVVEQSSTVEHPIAANRPVTTTRFLSRPLFNTTLVDLLLAFKESEGCLLVGPERS